MTGNDQARSVMTGGDPVGTWTEPVDALRRFESVRVVLPVHEHAPAPVRECWAVPLGGYRLLVDTGMSCELSEWQPVCPIPNTPPWLPGVINLRGTLVPLFDPARLMPDMRNQPGTGRLQFIVGSGDEAAAMVLDGMPHRQRMDGMRPDALPSELPPALAARVHAAYRDDDGWWLDCDLPGFLKDLGRQAATGSVSTDPETKDMDR